MNLPATKSPAPLLAPFTPRFKSVERHMARRKSLALRVPRIAAQWTLIAGALRVAATILIHLYSLSIGFGGLFPFGGSDDGGYFDTAGHLYYGTTGAAAPAASSYPTILALFFHLTGGPNLLLGQLLNALIGALTVGLGVLLVRELTRGRVPLRVRRRAQHWAGALLTFYPSLLWYSTQLLKDPPLILFGMSALYCQVLFLRRIRPVSLGVWALSLIALMGLRPYAVVAVVLALMLFVLRFNRKWLVPVLVGMAFGPQLLGLGLFGFNFIAPQIASEKLAQLRQSAYSVGGSSVGITIDYSNPVSFLTTFFYSFATAMFGPFPWQIKSGSQMVVLPETIGIWLLFPLWLRCMRDLLLRRKGQDQRAARDMTLFLFCLVLMGIVALFSDNIGANTRLRLLPWSAFLVFAAPRLARKKWKLF